MDGGVLPGISPQWAPPQCSACFSPTTACCTLAHASLPPQSPSLLCFGSALSMLPFFRNWCRVLNSISFEWVTTVWDCDNDAPPPNVSNVSSLPFSSTYLFCIQKFSFLYPKARYDEDPVDEPTIWIYLTPDPILAELIHDSHPHCKLSQIDAPLETESDYQILIWISLSVVIGVAKLVTKTGAL